MPGKRRVLGVLVGVARAIGLMLILLAILSVPQMRFLTARLKDSLGTLAALALGAVGILWLIAVECFIRFFDQFLSRN
jgi:hypothetical protein